MWLMSFCENVLSNFTIAVAWQTKYSTHRKIIYSPPVECANTKLYLNTTSPRQNFKNRWTLNSCPEIFRRVVIHSIVIKIINKCGEIETKVWFKMACGFWYRFCSCTVVKMFTRIQCRNKLCLSCLSITLCGGPVHPDCSTFGQVKHGVDG